MTASLNVVSGFGALPDSPILSVPPIQIVSVLSLIVTKVVPSKFCGIGTLFTDESVYTKFVNDRLGSEKSERIEALICREPVMGE